MKSHLLRNIRKLILLFILILLIVFCFTQRELLKNEVKAFTFQDHDTVKTEKTVVDGDHVIEQPIVFHTDSDLSVIGEIETNRDFMPFYRSLKENTIKGWLESSVYGGMTANSEFEFQTGFTTAFMPFHSFPFRSFVKGELPTITRDLEAMGYGGNIAFHPGMSSSYNRENVYPLLGFQEHIAIEDLRDPHKIRDFVSDSYDYERVEKEYEKYRKTSDKPILKGAYIEECAYIGDNMLDTLCSIKSKNELIADVIALLQSPAKNVISALQSGGNKLSGIVKTLSERPE